MESHLLDKTVRFVTETVGKDHILLNEPMREHTTFKIGGEVPVFCKPQEKEQIRKLIKYFAENSIDYYVMGNGSNLLVSDAGFDGVIIQLLDDYSHTEIVEDEAGFKVSAQAGARMWRLGMKIAEVGACGFEFATGIPGTIGGAIMMNAGAYGGEIKDVVDSVIVCDRQGNEILRERDELEFGYRTSAVSKKDYIVLEVVLRLEKGDKDRVRERIDELTEKRNTKQPLDVPSAGSTFKRPEGYYAAKLIDDAGLRGLKVGGAMVSEKHAGFVVNTGNATAADVIALTDKIKEKVFEYNGVKLELEVRKLGF